MILHSLPVKIRKSSAERQWFRPLRHHNRIGTAADPAHPADSFSR